MASYDEPGDTEDESEPDFADDEPDEPTGSCEECGTNLYPDDDEYLCDRCAYLARAAERWRGSRD